MNVRFTHSLLLLLAILVTSCGGGDGGGDNTIFTPPVTLSGKLDTGSLTANAALSQTVVASLANTVLEQAAVADDVWVVAIDENGEVQATAQLAQPLDLLVNFSLEVPSGHDYVIVFHTESTAGPILAVFMIEEAGLSRSVISLPVGMNDTDLGTITIDTLTQKATSDINDTLVALLPPPDTVYTDLDRDLIPDDFDWDVDNDGFVDGSGESTSVYYSLRGGNFNASSAIGNIFVNEIWLEGSYNTKDRTFTVYRADPPRLFIHSDLVLQQLYPPDIRITISGFNVWMDSPLSVDKNGRVISGDLRLSPFEPWVPVIVSANPDVNGDGTPGYDITLVVFGEVVVSETLTQDQLDTIGEDPAVVHGYLAVAWQALRGIEIAYQNAQQILTGYEYCFNNKLPLEFAGAGVGVTLTCPVFPGNGSQGTVNYAWFDTDPTNPQINPGDSFKITYNNCWLDDPQDRIDEFFNGKIELMGYYDVREPFIYMGVVSAGLSNLTRTETIETNGIYTIDADSVTTTNSTNPSPDADGPALWIQFIDYIWLGQG